MRVISTAEPVKFANWIELPAGVRVVVTDDVARQVESSGAAGVTVSGTGCYTRRYGGQDLAGKRLIAVRGDGIGDQLVVSGILRMLKTRYPAASIAFAVDPRLWEAWGRAEPDAPYKQFFALVPPAMHLETMWLGADYHLVLQDMVESLHHAEQPGIWEAHCYAAGIDDAAEHEMRPVPMVHAKARSAAAAFLRNAGIDDAAPLVVWQLAASSPVRSMGPTATRKALQALVAAVPGASIVATCGPWELAEYRDAAPFGVALCASREFATKVGLAARATCVVCPDSSLGHVTAGLDDGPPTVSLWASFLPEDRVSHYPNHRPLVGRCPYGRGPCRHHETESPCLGCPETRHGDSCAGIDSIGPERIVAAVQAAIEEKGAKR